jgi:hypothetical protein
VGAIVHRGSLQLKPPERVGNTKTCHTSVPAKTVLHADQTAIALARKAQRKILDADVCFVHSGTTSFWVGFCRKKVTDQLHTTRYGRDALRLTRHALDAMMHCAA